MELNIVLTIGKYALLVGIYAFVLVVFRGIIGQLAAESRREVSDAAAASGRRASARSRLNRVVPSPTRPSASQQAPEATVVRSEVADVPAAAERPLAPPLQASTAPEPPVAPSPEPELAAESERAPGMPHLHVIESGDDDLGSGNTVPLSAAVTIGRSEENSLRLSDRFVSSRHALICLRDGRRLLLDRGSTNGTFVNGERVDDEVELQDGDRVAMGNTVFEYRTG